MRCDNAGVEASVFGKLLVFLPMFVAAARRSGNREGQARLGSAFQFWLKHGVGEQFGGESWQILAMVVVEGEVETNVVDADFDALVGVVAEIHLDGQDAGCIRRLFGESRFIAIG